MSARGCEGVCVKPNMTKNAKTSMFQKQNSTKSVDGTTNKAKGTTTTCSFKMPNRSELSPMKLFKQIGGKMVAVVKMMSLKGSRRSCRKVTNSSEKAAISKSLVTPNIDSHRAEAIDDCIQFINMSSSLPRSNSVS